MTRQAAGAAAAVSAATAALTVFAMAAFAANSILCRLALADRSIDPAGFTAIRLAAGASTLVLLAAMSGCRPSGSWRGGLWLFAYAAAFSFAYVDLAVGTGALILFGAVQTTMILAGISAGERPRFVHWLGFGTAVAGLVVLVLPGVSAPAPVGAALMSLAGVAWGAYSLLGRGSSDPIAATAGNFAWALPPAGLLVVALLPHLVMTARGVLLATASGAIASALGYLGWYAVLKHLTVTRAAFVQLSVPMLAAVGGVAFLSETLSPRVIVSGVLILGGVALAVSRGHGPSGGRGGGGR